MAQGRRSSYAQPGRGLRLAWVCGRPLGQEPGSSGAWRCAIPCGCGFSVWVIVTHRGHWAMTADTGGRMLLAFSGWRPGMRLPCTEKIPNLHGPAHHLLDPTWPHWMLNTHSQCQASGPLHRSPFHLQESLAVLSTHFFTSAGLSSAGPLVSSPSKAALLFLPSLPLTSLHFSL